MLLVVQLHSCVWLFATPWAVAHQALLSMGFPRQEYWSGLVYAPPKDLLNPAIEPASPSAPALAGRSFATSAILEDELEDCNWHIYTDMYKIDN